MFTVPKTNEIRLANLRLLPDPKSPANVGAYWKGIRHDTLVETIANEFRERGWATKNWSFYLDGGNLIGRVSVGLTKTNFGDYVLGFQHSNNGRSSLRFYAGLETPEGISVVLNRLPVEWKHSSGLDLTKEISVVADLFQDISHEIPRQMAAAKRMALTPERCQLFLFQAAQRKLLPWSRLGRANLMQRNYWDLLLEFSRLITEHRPGSVRLVNPLTQMSRMDHFRLLLNRRPVLAA